MTAFGPGRLKTLNNVHAKPRGPAQPEVSRSPMLDRLARFTYGLLARIIL